MPPVADPRAVCLTCGHAFEWHDRAMARARLRAEPPFERPCYREVRGVACPCDAFRDSGEWLASWQPRPQRPLQQLALAVLLVVMGLGLLYAYRSQSPAIPQIPVTQAVVDIQAGRVRSIVISGSTAVLTLRDGRREQAAIAQPDNVIADAVSVYNAAHAADPVELRYESAEPFSVIGSVVLSLLPVVLLGGFFLYLMYQQRRR